VSGPNTHPEIPSPSPGASSDHLFANNVRFVSMAAIIGIHTIALICPMLGWTQHTALEFALVQPLKFGSICFFLISGFLLGERIHRYRPHVYFARRLRSVFVPWAFWLSCYCGLRLIHGFGAGRLTLHTAGILSYGSGILSSSLFETAYWFVPNLLLALAILLIFRRLLMDWRIGCVFLTGSLFYAVNVYARWVHVEHTRAVFGFIFYLWLGAWGSWHFVTVEKWVSRIPATAMAALVLVTGLAALGEAGLLQKLGSSDPLNTLRLTNQVFSVMVGVSFLKARRALWPHFINVRAQTFGLYLAHTPVLAVLGMLALRFPGNFGGAILKDTVAGSLLLIMATFTVTYGGCLLLVRFLVSIPCLHWIVGGTSDGKPAIPGVRLPEPRRVKGSLPSSAPRPA
jgi:peptidoglycan/LPS O-acetylase OafA/YrhL